MTGEFDKYTETSKWYNDLRSKSKTDDLVPILEDAIKANLSGQSKEALLDSLQLELAYQDRHNELHTSILNRIQMSPDKEMLWISLAGQSHYHLGENERALKEIDSALEVAKKTGNFQRHALNTKARIALALDRYDLLESCLHQIIELKIVNNQRDIAVERDFFDQADKNKISHEVATKYQKFLISLGA